VDPFNQSIKELEKTLRNAMRAFRERVAAQGIPGLNIPRVFSTANDDTDLDDAPDAFVGARLRPQRPLGGSAIALPEPEEDQLTVATGSRSRY
jgi:hypothetical protein